MLMMMMMMEKRKKVCALRLNVIIAFAVVFTIESFWVDLMGDVLKDAFIVGSVVVL